MMVWLGWFVVAQLLVASLITWGVIGYRWWREQPILEEISDERRPDVSLVAVGLTLAWVVPHVASAFEPARPAQEGALAGTALISAGLTLLVWSAVLVFRPQGSPLSGYGLRGEGVAGQLQLGAVGFLASLAPVLLMMLATLPWRSEEVMHPFLRLLQENGTFSTIAGVLLIAVVIAPLNEELLFRVVLQSWLSRHLGRMAGVWTTAIVFSMVHRFPDALGILPLALILGVVYDRRQSYLAVVVLHALFNAFNVVALLLQSQSAS